MLGMKIGDKVLVTRNQCQVIGELVSTHPGEDTWFDFKLKLSEYTQIGCLEEDFIQVLTDEKVFKVSRLDKIGHRTFTGSGYSTCILSDSLDEAIDKAKVWVKEQNPEAEFTDIVDEPNYHSKDERATFNGILCAEEKIDKGWPDSWIDIRITPFN